MTIFRSTTPLAWGELDLPLFGLASDWYGKMLTPPAGFSLAVDAAHLWFVAHHRNAAMLHPKARPGTFLSGLWEADVAELFLADQVSGRYLELNLAPNGAWWSCEFTARRQRADADDIAIPDIATFADLSADGSWLAAMAIPLDILRARLDFGPETRANVSMILGSPDQRFISAAALRGTVPDFHQPESFPKIQFADRP